MGAPLPFYAGTLSRRVLLESLSAGESDSFGSAKPVYASVGDPVWANVSMKTGRAQILADSDVATVQASIRLRFRLDVQHGWRASVVRMVDGAWVVDQVFHVDAVLPDFAGRKYTDLAVTGVGNGQR